ncbi:hypothetical protein [Paenibacillus sp. DS2015]|uniref:hypothetical protein n=1 Tax=Paenibacillus sp. DS2015 TaxID=3373917 RepID=UPI003D23E40D
MALCHLKEIAEAHPDKIVITEPTLKWIRSTFKHAWEGGKIEGLDEAYANARKWIGQ